MATTSTPSWTDRTAVIAISMLAKGAIPARGTIDLSSKFGGYLTMFVMRSGATAIDVAIQLRVRRLHSTVPIMHTAPLFSATLGKTTAVAGVAAAAGNGVGATSLTLNAAKTFAAGPSGDIILGVIDNTTTPTLGSEILRQAFATSTTVKLLEWPTETAHNDVTHVVADQAEVFEIWVDGGETIEATIDYSNATTGDSVCVGAYFASFNSIGNA